jgi:hypothetical protein
VLEHALARGLDVYRHHRGRRAAARFPMARCSSWRRPCGRPANARRRARRDRPTHERAREEIAAWREYNYLIINRDVKDAVDQLAHIIQAERCRTNRLTIRFPDVEVPD